MKLVPALALASALALIACAKKEDETTATNETKKEEPAPPPPKNFGELKTKPATIMAATGKAANTAGAKLGKTLGNSGTAALALDEDGSITCDSDTGFPKDARDPTKNTEGHNGQPGGWLSMADNRFAMGRFYCALSANTDNATTVQGSFETPKAFACAIGKMKDLAFNGKEVARKLVADKECFGKFFVEDTGLKEGDEIDVQVKAVAPAAIPGWDYQFRVRTVEEGGETGFDGEFLFKTTGDSVAFAVKTKGNQRIGSDVVMTNIDKKSGELRFVFRREKVNCDGKTGADLQTCAGTLVAADPEEWEGSQHLALRAKGTVNLDGVFSAVTGVEGFEARMYVNSATEIGGSVISAKGTLAKGITTRTYGSYDYGTFVDFAKLTNITELVSSISPWCFVDNKDPVAGACSGEEGIRFSKEGDFLSFLHPALSGYKTNDTLFNTVKPLAFKSLDLADSNL